MTFMKVKGHHRSSIVNHTLWLPNLVRRSESLMQVSDDDDLYGGQRSTEVKYSKL